MYVVSGGTGPTRNGRETTVAKTFGIDHEAFVQAIRHEAVRRAQETGQIDDTEAAKLRAAKLIYGVGRPGAYGVCYYGTWNTGTEVVDLIEIGALHQESFVQLTGTTVHELAHVLAGHTAGHGPTWKEAATRLGFSRKPKAAGSEYHLAAFNATLRVFASNLAARLADGKPQFASTWLRVKTTGGRPCSGGVGTKGGTSRGVGSGSRLRKYVCGHGQIIRAATDALEAMCGICGTSFELTA